MTDEQPIGILAPEPDDEEVKYNEQDETSDFDDVPRWRYVIAEGLEAHLQKPTEEQLLVLLRMSDILDDDTTGAIRLYGDALDALMLPDEAHRCRRWLLQGKVKAEAFVNVGPAAIRHWFPGTLDKEAPTNGPQARRRPRRR